MKALRHRLDRATRAYAPTRRVRFALARESIARFAGDRKLRILDAGCSEGLFSEHIAADHPRWTVEAVDIDEGVIQLAQSSFREAGLDNASARVGDVVNDLDEGAYDAVAALECLTLVEDDHAALVSFHRALKPGGLLVGHSPDRHWKPMFAKLAIWPGEQRHGYEDEELRELLRSSGFDSIRTVDTTRRLALFGREVALSHKLARGGLPARVVWFPFAVGIAWADRHGLTWGKGAGHYFEARRPGTG